MTRGLLEVAAGGSGERADVLEHLARDLLPLSDVVGDFAPGAQCALAVFRRVDGRQLAGPMTFDPGG